MPALSWVGPLDQAQTSPPPLFPGSGSRLSVLFHNPDTNISVYPSVILQGIQRSPTTNPPPRFSWIWPSQPHLASVYRVESPVPEPGAPCERKFPQVGCDQSELCVGQYI